MPALTEVLPWLRPRDVASLACTCSALAAAAASLTRLRVSDAARGLERFPVPIINTFDNLLYPFFSYSPFALLRLPPPLLPWGTLFHTHNNSSFGRPSASPSSADYADHCPCFAFESCTGTSEARSSTYNEEDPSPPCKKSRQQTPQAPLCGHLLEGELAYDRNSRLCCLSMHRSDEDTPFHEFMTIMECGPACCCSQSCKYRVTQRGLYVKVAIYRCHLKGWGLRAMQFIAKGSFVFEYAGELLTTLEAQSRQRQYDKLRKIDKSFVPSLLVLREHLPSGRVCLRLNIDATRVGNVARFVNHSCDGGNLQPCLARLMGCLIPKLVFFARKDIVEGEELTFSYGDEHDKSETYQCFCKTASCKGFLPFEET